jgi:DeoR/GlpR family transcriptional regulator of sugar metabolism
LLKPLQNLTDVNHSTIIPLQTKQEVNKMKQTDERKKSILEQLQRNGKIYVTDLSEEYKISEVTIRKNLQDLEDQGLLHRVHGGAILIQPERTAVESTLDQLAALHRTEKQQIAKAALPFVEDGDSLLFDTSTSAREVARLVMKEPFNSLTIITTSLQLSQELAVCKNINVIQIGGVVRSTLYTTMGRLQRIRSDSSTLIKLLLASMVLIQR